MYVLMISPNNFPDNDAGAVRDGYFGKIYMELGYEVIHIGMNPKEEYGVWNNIEYFSLYCKSSNMLHKLRNNINYKNMLAQKINSIYKEKGQPSLLHIYDISISGFLWAKKEAKRLNIPIIHDSVEWYSPCEFKLGRFSYPYILKEITNRFLVSRQIAVISISSYLNDYYIKKGIKSIRIPVIMEPGRLIPCKEVNHDRIKIVYAGSPAKKDYLQDAVIGFSLLSKEERKRFVFNIYGVDQSHISTLLNGMEIPEIKAFGRVKREEVIEALRQSDFSILLRPEKERYTKAGFPTKSVEAMMNGCAMLCNFSSDLKMYLNDDFNAIIVKECSSEAVKDSFRKIVSLSRTDIDTIKKNAYETAITTFDYHNYIESIKEFLQIK